MKYNHYLLGLALLVAGALPSFSQVSNDNEDEVYKVEARAASTNYREGEVLVKFKSNSAVRVKRLKSGKFMSSGVSSVDALFRQLGAEEVEELMPRTGSKVSQKRVKSFAGTEVKDSNLGKLFRVKLSGEKALSVYEAIEQLQTSDEVEYAEPNYLAYIMADADDYAAEPLYNQQWGLPAINMPALWSAEKIMSRRPVIAILDTGIDITHPDLADNIWTNAIEAEGEEGYDNDNNGFKNDIHGWDFINQTGNIRDFNGHGTHCAGIAAAIGNNGVGVVGANPDALIMPITIMQSDGTGDIATIIKGIDYAVANGADILNMSFGTYSVSSALQEALGKAYQTAVLVAAAGNNNHCLNHSHLFQFEPMPMFPAAYNFVLGVQASASNGRLANYSNYDDNGAFFSAYSEDKLYNYELQAPGNDIISTWPNGNYKRLNGTSMACPLVAGALSRLIQCKEIDSKEELFGDLIHSVTTAGDLDIYKTYQMCDANRQPSLSFVTYTIDDSEGDGDGIPDAGETIAIYPTVRNGWGQARNIRLSMELGELEDENIVEFLDYNNVDFGSELSDYAKNITATPLRLKINEACADNRHIKLILKVTCDEASAEGELQFALNVRNITKFSGFISENTTLSGGKTYYVDKDILVSGCTLTIEPGTRLEFADGKTLKITSGAHILARGEPGNMIVFTGSNFTIDAPTFQNNHYWTNEDHSILSYHQSIETPIEYTGWICLNENDYFNEAILPDLNLYSIVKDEYHNEAVSHTIIPNDTIEYCIIDNGICSQGVYLKDCISSPGQYAGERCNITNGVLRYTYWMCPVFFSNFVNLSTNRYAISRARYIRDNNFFNVQDYNGYILDSSPIQSPESGIIKMYRPSYFGTTREDLIRPYVREFGNCSGVYTQLDLSNMRTEPVAEAHGVVWKVEVDGYDAQDEYEEMPPLGVGNHVFQVYFNRPMNKNVAPQISFGVREPYTQVPVSLNGRWSSDGKIYTAFVKITGKTSSDGYNTIYVYGAEDDEFFEIPYEKTRFHINVQSAGSMATGFAAEAELGRVKLTWNNDENDFDDAMGFNVYRYTVNDAGIADTIRINEEIVDIETTTYTDYDVVPGTTYYYLYRVLSTDLQEYDVSNVVAVTPLTSSKGDANGSGDVDVADVITTVNYASGQQPKPFIFEAADMNDDLSIDILDVIGIIKQIMNPNAEAKPSIAAVATYTIEDGVVYVDSPVEIAGVQIQLATSSRKDIRVAEDMKGFEHTSAWLSDNDYLFLGYNMNGKTLTTGKHAILIIDDAQIADIRLSDVYGHNIQTISDTVVKIDRMARDVMTVNGIYDLQGRKITGNTNQLSKLPKGVYIVNGQKVVR
ncbi:MAG: S8 family serine peptidase [Prevotella sp.]|nr:S8 family serine peptidase [Prevotella sp.]